jgi:hypothetical protein
MAKPAAGGGGKRPIIGQKRRNGPGGWRAGGSRKAARTDKNKEKCAASHAGEELEPWLRYRTVGPMTDGNKDPAQCGAPR